MRVEEAGRAAPLIVDLASRTVILHGEEIELPPREFRLLALLAERIGEPVTAEELISAVWPDEPWTDRHSLHVVLTKLRRRIDGADKFGSNIRNRRGFGYVLDLDPTEVRVVEGHSPRGEDVIDLEDGQAADREQPDIEIRVDDSSDDQPPAASTSPTRLRPLPLALISFLTFALLVAASSIGYLFSTRQERQPASGNEVAKRAKADPPSSSNNKREVSDRKKRHRGRAQSKPNGSGSANVSNVVGGTAPIASGSSSPDDSSGRSGASKDRRTAPEPALPPAPTGYLYHLVHPETGDHFVTTDGGTASEYEGKGYQGGAIGGIYTSPPDGLATKSVATNAGTGYVFATKSPRTEPASRTLPLYYSSNGKGDFFYTTSAQEADQTGWEGGLVGYVRAL